MKHTHTSKWLSSALSLLQSLSFWNSSHLLSMWCKKKLPYPSFCSWWCFLPNFGAWPTISSGSAGAAARVIYLGSNLKDENIFNIFLWHKWIRLITCFSYILMISLDCWNKMADCLINQPICSNDFNRSYKIIRS